VTWHAKGIQVDLWFATDDTWGSHVLCRTGSQAHNVWLQRYAVALDKKWIPTHGIYSGGQRHGATEEGIYHALGIDPIPPERRELEFLPYASIARTAADGGSVR
jgi:DNA polymerase (family 10)